MSTQPLTDEYKAQLLRVYGVCTPSMLDRVEGMGEEKLRRDLEIMKRYPSKQALDYQKKSLTDLELQLQELEDRKDTGRVYESYYTETKACLVKQIGYVTKGLSRFKEMR